MKCFFRTQFVGFELRSADPNAQDIILSRDLGYAAVYTCRVKKVNATMVAIKGHDLITVPLSEMVDPDTQEPAVHCVDINSLVYTVATSYMIQLTKADLRNEKNYNRWLVLHVWIVRLFEKITLILHDK